jgi:rare lipoprotein A
MKVFSCIIVLFLIFIGTSSANERGLEEDMGPKYWVKASWYGDPAKKRDNFHGKTMANGKIMNTYDKIAAHKEYPLGTVLRVTDPETRRSVIVKVQDRGPFDGDREIDLSYAAAKKLGLIEKGVGYLHIVPVNVASS